MKELDVAKAALYGIFLNYYCYYVITGSFSPGGTVLFLGIALLFVGTDVLRRRHIRLGREISCWITYAIASLVTTAIILFDSNDMGYISDIVKYVQRTMIIFMVAYICERENSIRFGLRLMAVTAVALAVAVISVTGNYQLKLDITSGANLSENDTGAILSFGCFAILFAWGKRKRVSVLLSALKATGIVLCLVVMFLVGSRKSILALGIMLAVLCTMCYRDYLRQLNLRRTLTLVIVGAAVYTVAIHFLLPYAEQTSLYRRLFGLEADVTVGSDDLRMDLYRWAFEDFLAHPIFGLGFNRFVDYHGNYTHSTYAEPLACSGLIGMLYLYPYYLILKKQLLLILRSRPGSYGRLKQKEMLAYFCMTLFIGAGIPFRYKDAPCIILGTFVAHQAISIRELKAGGHISAEY